MGASTSRQPSDLIARLLPRSRVGRSKADDGFVPALVDALIAETVRLGASDLHLLPDRDGLAVQWRVDGVLGRPERLPVAVAANVVTRFKVLAKLLTYETQRPQEGQLRAAGGGAPMRISTFPTMFGEKIVARLLPSGAAGLARLADIGLPSAAHGVLAAALAETSGMVLLVGPSGSGKTTTAYATLREITRRSGGRRSIATLEDPIEVVLPGVAQSQVAPHAGFDLRTGLRALVRQDPEVIFVGEIRDAETAQIAYQAALTGQLVVTTFHATDAAAAVVRLLDMGIPAYLVRGATRTVVAQRLVRKRCACRSLPRDQPEGGQPEGVQPAGGCAACNGTGYHGRRVVAEAVGLSEPGGGATPLSSAIQEGVSRRELAEAFHAGGVAGLRRQADALVDDRVTDHAEVERVLGAPPAGPPGRAESR